VVEGPGVERLVASVNFTDAESLAWFHRSLESLGVIAMLREAGAKEGDTVVLENVSFDFVE